MFADACKIVSILVVVWFQNRGLTITLCVLLPFVFCFTRHVQKNMLASQIQNRKAVAVINYISQVFLPVESLGMEIQTIQSAVAGIHRINEFFELEERKDNEKNTAEMQRFLIAPPLTSDVRSHCKFLKWLEILYSGLEMEKDRGFRREKL